MKHERLVSFPPLTEMFYFSGFAAPHQFYSMMSRQSASPTRLTARSMCPFGTRRLQKFFQSLLKTFCFSLLSHGKIDAGLFAFYANRFPHSEIPGSKVGSHLPETYRRHPTSFIASRTQGIHHLPIIFLDPTKF